MRNVSLLQTSELQSKARQRRFAVIATAVASAVTAMVQPVMAGTTAVPAANTSSLRPVGENVPTISLSGSTAMRNFTISPGSTLLTPGTPITLGSGAAGESEVNYTAASGFSTSFQLASGNFSTPDATSGNTQAHSAMRVEWHEQGSVEGVLELADSQIDDAIYNNTVYNPTSGNATYANRQKFGNGGPLPPTSISGFQLNAHPNGLTARDAQAQNRVQMAISDVAAQQGFSVAGAGAFNLTPGAAGYGKGNPALVGGALGTAGARRSLVDQTALDFSTSKVDPGTGVNYVAGNPGEHGGVNNLRNNAVAQTATTFAANPGTGLERLNRTQAQFLQATGRLPNGADFNVTTRDVNSGTLNVASVNVGLDPSFAVGENDTGNGNTATGGTDQTNVGPSIAFSNKTAGGAQLRPTLQNSRMAIGHLSLSDVQGVAKDNGSGRPLRVMAYRDDANDLADNSNGAGHKNWTTDGSGNPIFTSGDPTAGQFVKPNLQSITDGSYVIYQNETYVTVRRPDGTYADNDAATEAIKGDNAGNDVRDYRQNILNAAAQYPFPNGAVSLANPADALLANGFIVPKAMAVSKAIDGINQSGVNPGYDKTVRDDLLGNSSVRGKFDIADASAVTTGSSSTYGFGIAPAAQEQIAISGSNYLFGNFNQNGIRDFSAVKAAVDAQAKLQASGVGTSMFSGSVNSSKVSDLAAPLSGMLGQTGTFTGGVANGTAGASKGDLIVMGDYNSDGAFTGKDLYLLARGAALADSKSTDQLTAASGANLGDRLRNGVLLKNAALQYMQANTTPQQKTEAAVNATAEAVANAFNKFDVNRDGKVSRRDAAIVDKFIGKDYRNLDHQLAATINSDGAPTGSSPVPISLVDIELDDTGDITSKIIGGTSDFKEIHDTLHALPANNANFLPDGDANFDGAVTVGDLGILATNFNLLSGAKWSLGDFNLDGQVTVGDLGILATNFNTGPGGGVNLTLEERKELFATAAAQFPEFKGIDLNAIPEPGSLSLLAMATFSLVSRRRRQQNRRR